MYERIKYLYNIGKLTENQVQLSVDKGFITQAQCDEILAG